MVEVHGARDSDTVEVRMTVNCVPQVSVVPARMLLVDYLRHQVGAKGTHIGCEHGVCGACTVLVDQCSTRSCLMFAVQADGADVTTVEGLATEGKMNLLQQSFREHHALQCGFCTPGLLMVATEFLKRCPHPSEEEVREAISGNLCRCTGYINIVRAVLVAAKAIRDLQSLEGKR